MTKLTSVLLTLLVMTGCTNEDTTTISPQKSDTTTFDTAKHSLTSSPIDDTFRFDFFKAIPDTIDGSGEYFAYDTNKLANNKYIFCQTLLTWQS
jgi:hypothetical protein